MENSRAVFVDTPSHGFYSHESEAQKTSDDLKPRDAQLDWDDEDTCFIRSSN
ncbi:hypothetical protein [Marinobacterium rhizophilum]|uniref:hypothetical protein n=1 Tax=Marinobacterium rhizophilum TaxID=420402 RepID=UPI00037AE1B0|nr:hypothetical protein [Marinobacterium rhizophilum]